MSSDPPQKNTPIPIFYVCERHSYETLKLLRSQGTKTDFTSQLAPNTHYAFKGEMEKEEKKAEGGKDNTIDLNIPHITKA